MKILIFIVLPFLSLLALSHPAVEDEHSELLKSIISRADDTIVVDDETFYIVNHCVGCMDGGSTVYDSNGKSVCGYSGYSGTWDKKCVEFLNRGASPDDWQAE